MKMESGLFWGIIIILIGLSIILKFPVFRIVIGAILIFIGIKVILGGFGYKVKKHWCNNGRNNIIFSEMRYTASDLDGKEFNVVFGEGKFDLTNVDLSTGSKEVKIHTVFGSSVIKLNKDKPCKITANAVFGGVRLPNGNTTAFGTTGYQTENFKADSAYLDLKVDVVFGGVEFE